MNDEEFKNRNINFGLKQQMSEFLNVFCFIDFSIHILI